MKILRNKFFPMFTFSVYKILFSLPVLIIESLSLLGLVVTTIAVFFNYNTANEFLLNFQYIILFFINLFLLLFIVLSTVKVFGDEISDGTFLLLISKPYSRLKIFICKFIAVFLLTIAFLAINFGMVALIGTIINSIKSKPEVFNQILNTLFWLTLYSLFFSFVVLSGAIFVSLAFSAQFVLLILTIFSSMFLLGGLPFSLISKMYESSNRGLTMRDSNIFTGDINVQLNIKNIIFFEESIRKGKVRYPTLIKKIYDFYSTLPADEVLNPIHKEERRTFYRNLGFFNEEKNKFVFQDIKLETEESGVENGKGTLTYEWATPFLTLKEIKEKNDIIFKELLELTQTYKKSPNDHSFAYSRSDQITNENNTFWTDKDKIEFCVDGKLTACKRFDTKIGDFYGVGDGSDNGKLSQWKYNFTDSNENDENYQVREPITNIVFVVINKLDSEIRTLIARSNELNTKKIVDNASLKRYKNIESFYRILTYFNIFEHWNQLWTTIIGYPNLELDLNFTLLIEWEKYRNYLNSYQDFPLAFREDNTIDVKKLNYFLDEKVIMIAYGTLATILLVSAVILIKRKDIT